MARAVCIKVPPKGSADRPAYESLGRGEDPAAQRQAWFERQCDCYVGRPKNDGGWYQVPEVKRGSIWANPFPLKQYSLPESLRRYRQYLAARLADETSVGALVGLLPAELQPLLARRAKSVAHLQLELRGPALRERARALEGRRLGCWCAEPDQCHAGALAEVVNGLADRKRRREPGELKAAKSARMQEPGSERGTGLEPTQAGDRCIVSEDRAGTSD